MMQGTRFKVQVSLVGKLGEIKFISEVFDISSVGQQAPSQLHGVQKPTFSLISFFLVVDNEKNFVWVPAQACTLYTSKYDD